MVGYVHYTFQIEEFVNVVTSSLINKQSQLKNKLSCS